MIHCGFNTFPVKVTSDIDPLRSLFHTPLPSILDTNKRSFLASKNTDSGTFKIESVAHSFSSDCENELMLEKKHAIKKQTILIVADVDSLVFIEVTRAAVVKKISIPGAKGLNDVALDKRGNVFVTDSKTKKIHMIGIAKLDVETYVEGLEEPNGITVSDKTIYFVDGDGFYKLDKDKEKILIAKGLEGSPDGIEQIDDETFLVSCISGMIWQIKLNGEKKLLIDTTKDSIGAADIGYDKKNKILYVPTFWKNVVTAYQMK